MHISEKMCNFAAQTISNFTYLNYQLMKKSTFFTAFSLVALWLIPQTIKADDCQFTPNALPGQAADRTDLEVNITMQVGDGGMVSMRYGSLENLATSNSAVAALHSRKMGVYMVGVGTADVTYTESVRGRETSCSTDHIIHYTVEQGNPVAYFAAADGAALTEYNLTIQSAEGGDAGSGVTTGGGAEGGGGTGEGGGTPSYWTPTLVMNTKSFTGMGFSDQAVTSGIKYASSNPDVAEINESTGAVTIKGIVGETTISATWDGDTNWKKATASYVLKTRKAASIWFQPYYATDTVGNVLKLTPNHTEGISIDAWESSRPEVATVDKEGNVTMLHFGTATIDAIFNGDNEYAPTRGRFYLTVSKKKPHIAFAQSSIKLDPYVGTPALPELVKPADISTDANKYTWRSNNTNVIYIHDINTGEFTIERDYGYAQVQCFFAGDDNYLPDTARCDVEIITSGITVAGTYVTLANNGDVFGDGSVIYTFDPVSGNKSITLNKSEFDAKGGIFIQSTAFLRVLVQGNCHIKNAVKAIDCTSAVFVWCENRKDTITIDATHTAITAQEAKIHDCYLFANGGQYGLNTEGGITVSAGGYVFAQGAVEAIRARNFIKGENAIGGIEIMTKDVEFVSWQEAADDFGGFYSDYSKETKATFVELGKVPLPVSNSEIKEIGFEGEGKNPDENLDVVFSGSKEDKFNEDEAQIEITTTTSSDQVSNALELHVACSSEWLKLLPGVLVFDIPAGEGKFEIQCDVAAGFHAEAFIEGKGEAKLDAPKDGWIVCSYNVLEQTHVILYLQEDKSAVPARAVKAQKEATPGLAIKAIQITPKNTTTAIETNRSLKTNEASKVLIDNQILILRGDKVYTLTGQEVR